MHAGRSGTLVCADRPWIVAHRGAWAEAPQNSIQAFEAAASLGCDAVELDLRRTSDGRLVVIHNARIGRRLVAASRHDELRERAGEPAPARLEEVLERLAGRIAVDIELKEDGYAQSAVAVIARRLAPDQYVLTSFIDGALQAARRAAPEVTSGLLLGPGESIEVMRSRRTAGAASDPPARARPQARGQAGGRERERDLARRVAAAQVDFLAPHASLVRAGVLAWAAQHNLPAWVWTVNDARTLRTLLGDERVAAVISDRPERALALKRALDGP